MKKEIIELIEQIDNTRYLRIIMVFIRKLVKANMEVQNDKN